MQNCEDIGSFDIKKYSFPSQQTIVSRGWNLNYVLRFIMEQ